MSNTNKQIHLFILFVGRVHIKTNFSFVRLLSTDCLQPIEMGYLEDNLEPELCWQNGPLEKTLSHANDHLVGVASLPSLKLSFRNNSSSPHTDFFTHTSAHNFSRASRAWHQPPRRARGDWFITAEPLEGNALVLMARTAHSHGLFPRKFLNPVGDICLEQQNQYKQTLFCGWQFSNPLSRRNLL